jgi:cytochrome c oxidase assembly protein subunit 11
MSVTRSSPARAAGRGNARVVTTCLAVVVTMGAAAWAAVPLYQMFCQATGFGGTTQRATRAADTVLDQTMTVRFDANVALELPWTVVPVERTVEVRLGETRIVNYRATNMSQATITGTAAFNVAPEMAGQYFNKLACFCFTEQTLAPGETIDMPVSFFIDPAATNVAGQIGQITLSYTFYRVDKPAAAGVAATKGGEKQGPEKRG